MKSLINYSLLFLFTAAVFSCQPESYKTLDAPASYINSLTGTWKLSRVTQTDEDAANKGFPYQVLDLTSVFPYTDFTMTLNSSGGVPTTFTTAPGNSPKIIKLTSGNWTVDDPKFPNVITMANATDTARITLGAYPIQASPVLKISVQKRDAVSNKLLISYSYQFTKK